MTLPLLVTGGTGQIGAAVARLARSRGIDVWAPPRTELDLLDHRALAAAVLARPWRAVINCAAYTAVDRAESEPELARAVNAGAPEALARAAAQAEVAMVQLSTDYVFDGGKPSPYREDDPVRPLGVYGASKEAGEAAVRDAQPHHAIVRTAWVVSAGPRNFLDTMLRLAGEREEVRVVDDQHGCPTSAEDIAEALLAIVDRLGERSGTWHFVNSGEASWHGLAAHLFARLAERGRRVPRLVAIPTSEYPTPARRPANSQLATDRIARDFRLRPRPWQAAVDAILATRFEREAQGS